MKLLIISTAMAASFAMPAAAREVQLMNFGAPAAEVPTEGGLEQELAAAMNVPVGLEGALAGDFGAMGAGGGFPPPTVLPSADYDPAAHIPAASTIVSVPRWMRTGMMLDRAGASPTMSALPMLAATCADAPYRRRFDLPASTEARRARLFPLIAQVACEAGVPAGLFDALVHQESRYNLAALSPKGAMGLTQLMPGTARYLKVSNPWDPVENLRGGARYLREQISEFGRVDLALAAYNAGPGRVRAGRRIPPFRETVNYVSTITGAWASSFPRMATLMPMGPARPTFPTLPAQRSPFRTASLISYTDPRSPNPM